MISITFFFFEKKKLLGYIDLYLNITKKKKKANYSF